MERGGSATGTLGRLRESGFTRNVASTAADARRGRVSAPGGIRFAIVGRACTIARFKLEKTARSTAATLHERVIAPAV